MLIELTLLRLLVDAVLLDAVLVDALEEFAATLLGGAIIMIAPGAEPEV